MKNAKKVWSMIQYNGKTLVGFEFLFKILTFVLFVPLFVGSFNMIMKVTGYSYLTLENIVSFLFDPLTLFLLFLLILFMMIYSMFDTTSIILLLDASYQKQKMSIVDVVRESFRKCKRMFHYKNILLAFMVLFMIPFLNIGVTSNFISTIQIPEFILEFILQNKILLPLFLIFVLFLVFLLLRWLYALHYFVLEDVSFKEARKKSISLGKGTHFKDLCMLILVQLFHFIFYFLFVLLGILVLFLLNRTLVNIVLLKSVFMTAIWLFIAFSFFLFTILATPISYATISLLYYFHKDAKKEKIKHLKIQDKEVRKSVWIKRGILLLSVITFIVGTIFTYGLYLGKYNLNIEYIRTLEVTAHRGASVHYPENTMSAFVGAKNEGADWIELDVQQTKDGEIIVIHDHNLKRTTGLNKNTWEVTYADIQDLDAGSFFDEKYKGEHIPLLKEVLQWAKENGMKLNIELKPTGREVDFEKQVVDLVTDFAYAENCVITSQVYEVLENVKKYNDQIETVYVMSIAYGDILLLKDANHFSVEASNVTSSLVKKVHNEGKELYVWTVNTEDNIQKMIDLKVDNIITDNIGLAKDTIYASKTSNFIKEYIKWIEKLF